MSKSGFDAMIDKFDCIETKLEEELKTKSLTVSNVLAGDARMLCSVKTGNLRLSIEAFCETTKNGITGGAVTANEYAKYVEFGTGPTGTNNGGHPLDDELDITRKTEKWLAKIPDVGFRYVSGQKANPYMYTAMKQNENDIVDLFGTTLKEVINGG